MLDPRMKRSPHNDLFPNVELIRSVRTPTLIIHGLDDEEVPVEHGKLLRDNGKNVLDMWIPPGCGHNDIDIKQTKEFYKKLAWFLKQIEILQKGKCDEEMLLMNRSDPWPVGFIHLYHNFMNEIGKVGINDIQKKIIIQSKDISSSNKSSSRHFSSGKDEKGGNSIKSKSRSFVEFSSRNNSMQNPKMIGGTRPKEIIIKELEKEIEEEEKKEEGTPE